MKFEDFGLEPEILRSLETLGFKRPTDIQYKAIRPILEGEDVLAIAQTGTGKTAAFAIPVINILHRRKRSKRATGIRCVVMVPTHELAIQINGVFQQLGKHTKVQTFGIFGGVEQNPQIARLEKGLDILIATPGRLFDLVSQGHLRLNMVEILILDEADHMLALGFYKDIEDLIKFLPQKRQTLFFSATIDEKIKKLAYSLVQKPIRIQISPKDPVAKNIDHAVIFVAMDDKRFFLERLINENPEKKFLVFVRTKIRAERVAKAMERVEIETETIHGDKDQHDRAKVMTQFRRGGIKVMIATDVSARGIDIADVDYVINYDLPEQPENYVHRIGRTGRGTRRGNAISLCSPEEHEYLTEIETYIGKEVEVLDIAHNEYTETIELTKDTGNNNWKALIKEVEEAKNQPKRKKKK
ncbi:MAG: DEAD/DEAH box helicase [Bacteroidia bacterium]|nr:DEAD/DEAH box helicase [Bacteroidia bacterium]